MLRILSKLVALWLLLLPLAAFPFDVVQITNNATADVGPAISGSNAVWMQCDGGTGLACQGGDWEIYFWDGSFPIAPIRITDNNADDRNPDISGSSVVWQGTGGGDSEIYFWDGSLPVVAIPLTDNDFSDSSPAISGANVVWQQCTLSAGECSDDREIYFWDGTFPIDPVQVTNNDINDWNPAISGSKVVWEGYGHGAPAEVIDLYFWDGSFPIAPIQLTHNSAEESYPFDWRPDISGSTVVWVGSIDDQVDILSWDGSFPVVPTAISDDVRGEWVPAISGANVVWEDHPENDYVIQFWDGSTIANLTNTRRIQDESPDISASNVVWQGCPYDDYLGCVGDYEIYLANVSADSVPSVSFAGLVLLALLMIATAMNRRICRGN